MSVDVPKHEPTHEPEHVEEHTSVQVALHPESHVPVHPTQLFVQFPVHPVPHACAHEVVHVDAQPSQDSFEETSPVFEPEHAPVQPLH